MWKSAWLSFLIFACGGGGMGPTTVGAVDLKSTRALVVSTAEVAPANGSIVTEGTQGLEEYREFLRFLDNPDQKEAPFESKFIVRHLEALSAVLPEGLKERLEVPKATEAGNPALLADSAGTVLLRWWNRQNRYPATQSNERLLEHLQRVSYVFRHYTRKDAEHRLDDRGRVYLRFGPPDRSQRLDLGRGGEFWVYAFHPAAEYVFVRERGSGYRMASPTDLLPRRLQRGLGPSERGMKKAVRGISLLESVYEQLSHYQSRYGTVYADLSMYKEQLRQAIRGLSPPFDARPHTFVTQKMEEIRHYEAEAQRRRERTLPSSHTSIDDGVEDLPIAAQWIRRLDEDGETEVELHWSAAGQALQASEHGRGGGASFGYLLNCSFVELSESFEQQDVRRTHLLYRSEDPGGTLQTQTESFSLEEARHAALQVDLFRASVQGDMVQPQSKVKVGVSRADSMEALQGAPAVLEVSDLKPVVWRDSLDSIREAPVYPFRTISSSTPLGLRFEIYHLRTNSNGRTRYTVAYEARRKTEEGGIAGVLGMQDEERTEVTTTTEGERSRTTELIVLDPKNWDKKESQSIRVTVRVIDERSEQSVERSIEFNFSQRKR